MKKGRDGAESSYALGSDYHPVDEQSLSTACVYLVFPLLSREFDKLARYCSLARH